MTLAKMLGAALAGRYLHKTRFGRNRVNVNKPERWFSTIAGLVLSAFALRRGRGLIGRLGAASLGGLLARRGLTGRCNAYRALGVRSL